MNKCGIFQSEMFWELFLMEHSEELESLLENESKMFSRLIRKRQRLDFGSLVEKEDLESLLLEVKKHADAFLNSKGHGTPFIELGEKSEYDSLLGTIVLEQKELALAVPAIAHEYAHHLQYAVFGMHICAGLHQAFKEGHARGVQRHISGLYASDNDNEAYLYGISGFTFVELKSCYAWACRETGKKPRESLLTLPGYAGRKEDVMLNIGEFPAGFPTVFGIFHGTERPSRHAIGNTLFLILEKRAGKGIYGDALKKE